MSGHRNTSSEGKRTDMSQNEINEREWKNPDNWSTPIGFYFSKRDSRVWVHKPQPWMGWTLNLANPSGGIWALLFMLLPCLLMAAILVFVILQK